MSRFYNFSPGPATLPLPVLERMKSELLEWNHTHASVMEISHRRPEFMACVADIEKKFRALMGIPSNYQVLFLAGGATAHFAFVPMNLLGAHTTVDYCQTGYFSSRALRQARAYAEVNVVTDSTSNQFTHIAPVKEWHCNPKAAYLHYTTNETLNGLQFSFVPEVSVPLVTDMSSDILSKPVDVSRFGMIYASAQKNLGLAGTSVLIIREDLLERTKPAYTPEVFNYQHQVQLQSMSNTPPTFAWYVMGLICEWMEEQGGVAAIGEINARKAQKLYACVDAHTGFYKNSVELDSRSVMNVVFDLPSEALTEIFLKESAEAGLLSLKGHKARGGLRASIYNAMPEAGVDALIQFMQGFVQRYG